MNKIAFVLLSVIVVLVVFVALILGNYWIIALPAAGLILSWIIRPRKREEEEVEKLKEISRKL